MGMCDGASVDTRDTGANMVCRRHIEGGGTERQSWWKILITRCRRHSRWLVIGGDEGGNDREPGFPWETSTPRVRTPRRTHTPIKRAIPNSIHVLTYRRRAYTYSYITATVPSDPLFWNDLS